MSATQEISVERPQGQREIQGFEVPVDVRTAARFLGVSPSLVYAYVERKQIPHSGYPLDSGDPYRL